MFTPLGYHRKWSSFANKTLHNLALLYAMMLQYWSDGGDKTSSVKFSLDKLEDLKIAKNYIFKMVTLIQTRRTLVWRTEYEKNY